jgi:threonine dehydrogenase-like Zn-dependent dehydrogenase
MTDDTRYTVEFTGPTTVEVTESPVPAPDANELGVRTRVSAISPGTELLIYRGDAPQEMAADETIDALEGDLGFPLSYGYAAVGDVTAVGRDVTDDWLGRTVFAFHPHESHFLTTPEAVSPVPPECPPEVAAFLPAVETAVNFLMDGRPTVGERVAVFGQGIVGLLTTSLLDECPLETLVAVEPRRNRRLLAADRGADRALDPETADVPATLRSLGEDGNETDRTTGVDLSYELSGDSDALDDAIAGTGYGGRVVVGSWYGDKRADLGLGGRFHRSRLRVRSSQVSTIDPEHRGRWDTDRRLDVAWDHLPSLDVDELVTDRVPVEESARAYRALDQRPGETLGVLLTYES